MSLTKTERFELSKRLIKLTNQQYEDFINHIKLIEPSIINSHKKSLKPRFIGQHYDLIVDVLDKFESGNFYKQND